MFEPVAMAWCVAMAGNPMACEARRITNETPDNVYTTLLGCQEKNEEKLAQILREHGMQVHLVMVRCDRSHKGA